MSFSDLINVLQLISSFIKPYKISQHFRVFKTDILASCNVMKSNF